MDDTPLELLGTEDKDPMLLRNVGDYMTVGRE
jgi:hypothetical protein